MGNLDPITIRSGIANHLDATHRLLSRQACAPYCRGDKRRQKRYYDRNHRHDYLVPPR